MRKIYDVVVVGGSLGGIMAALSLAKEGKKVLLTEETAWIGGQLTSQAVPPDEHQWIEEFGCTKTYRDFRNRVRDFYKTNYPIKDEIKYLENFDPGDSSVSRLSHEPRVALHIFKEMILPYECNGTLELITECKVIKAEVSNDEVKGLVIKDFRKDKTFKVEGKYYIDGTDTGELLPLTGCEYIYGAESREMTGEEHALDNYEPSDMQPVTWVAAVDYIEGEDHTIEKPKSYDYFKSLVTPYDNKKVLSWFGPDSSTGKAKEFGMFTSMDRGLFPLWNYRRIVNPKIYKDNFQRNDITLINWPQNDYFLGNLFEDVDANRHAEMAKELTLSFIYWLQTEAEREDGGKGYKGIRLRPDVLGTEDGLAMAPYIRESRRIKAEYTILESDINAEQRDSIVKYHDTVGVGCYHIDLHITTKTNTFGYWSSYPFEIPLGAMIPVRIKNLIPGCKNIGTTHLTNSCFRLHPVEWNIGEVAGYLASIAIDKNITPKEIRNNEESLKEFQNLLIDRGIELHWPENKVHAIE